MKTRIGFVSNSSSTSFVITNKSGKKLHLTDFAKEVAYLADNFAERYDYDIERYNQATFIESAEENNILIEPGDNIIIFGDEDGTVIGHVCDYMLRDGGETLNFIWRYHESLR